MNISGTGFMIRSLLETRRRNPSNTAMVDLIDRFITVQVRVQVLLGQ